MKDYEMKKMSTHICEVAIGITNRMDNTDVSTLSPTEIADLRSHYETLFSALNGMLIVLSWQDMPSVCKEIKEYLHASSR